MKIIPSLLVFLIFLMSCRQASSSNQTEATDANALEAQVLALHDTVMLKLNETTSLSSQLRAIKATVKETPEGKMESPEGLDQKMASLKLSEQGMWEWMKSYTDTKPTLAEDQLKPFMEKQLDILAKINQDMLSSIEKAEAWIATHPTN